MIPSQTASRFVVNRHVTLRKPSCASAARHGDQSRRPLSPRGHMPFFGTHPLRSLRKGCLVIVRVEKRLKIVEHTVQRLRQLAILRVIRFRGHVALKLFDVVKR